ncbi:MAG: ABC transporter substrate-binding protein [Bacteriovoracia bacterium]
MYKIFFSVVVVILITAGCRRASISDAENIVQVPLMKEVATLDPAVSYDTVSAKVLYQSYEPLYHYHYLKRPYSIQPLLAKDMPTISDGEKTYTIRINPEIRYHDHPAFNGKARYVKAQDFINQFKRLAFKPTASTGWWLFEDTIVGLDEFRNTIGDDFKKFFKLKVDGLKAPDATTLIIKLKRPNPQLLHALTMTFAVPIPKEIIKYHNNDLSQKIIGTGPFVFSNWEPSKKLVFKRFEHHREVDYPSQGDRFSNEKKMLEDAGERIPFVHGVNFHVIKEAPNRWLQFIKKKLDVIVLDKDNYAAVISPSGNLSPALAKKGIKLQIAPTLTFRMLAFNMSDPIIGKNLKLRQAIAHAIDMKKYIEIFTNNIAQRANSIYPPGIPGYNPSKELPYEYDIIKAQKLLKDAGYPKGKGLPPLKYDVRADNSDAIQMAEFIKRELQKIGIKINIIINSFPEFLKKSYEGDLQFWQAGWSMDYPDAGNVLQLLVTKNHPPGPNSTQYSNPEFDRMFNKLDTLDNDAKKFQLMEKMENMVNQDLPWIMQFYVREYILHHHYIKNFRYSDLIFDTYKYVKLTPN